MNPLPSSLLEASNGILLVIIVAMTAFSLAFLLRKFRQGAAWRDLYIELKAAIALAVFLTGTSINVFVRWWFGYMRNHGIDALPWKMTGTALVILGTCVAIWGGICWIKVITPVRYPRTLWVALTLFAVLFGVGLASL